MATIIIFTAVVLALVFWSLRERVRIAVYGVGKGLDTEPRDSPFSRALANLIGLAGGIYLSLVLLLTFLDIKVPSRVHFGKVELEPLATLAVVIAIVQPLLLQIYWAMRRRF